ncbi:SDR family oxidoreductase [Streptomyces sp. NPDC006879]|uniref:SDR family oxidoreductase n=1 Tax=Streptomyces sp. NPDC006879 TaxID=3364767 RepID=UPI0036C3D19A
MGTILVTGGTGTLGSLVCARLRSAGHEVRVLSRHAQPYAVDLRDGSGLDTAVASVDTIVHCASSPSGGDEKAAAHLIDAARAHGVRHLVYISIVGVDRIPLGYYRTKHHVEQLVEGSGLGWTVLRTTQFHELVHQLVSTAAKLPVMMLPAGLRIQPVEVAEVADRLAGLAAAAPAGRVPDMGGPQVRTLPELARAYLRATGRRRPVLQVPIPGKTMAAFRNGDNLTPTHAEGSGTWEDFLHRRYPSGQRRRSGAGS